MLEIAVGVIAAIMPSARAWPQFVRIVVRNDGSGVSVLAWTLVLCNFTTWAVYGVATDLPVLIIANVGAGSGAAAVLIGLAQRGVTSIWRPFVTVAGTVLVTASIDAFIGDQVVWAIATALAVCMFLPQVWTVFRTDPSGVSPVTWWLGIAAGVVWVSYGWLIGQVQIAAPHAVMVPCAVAILWRIYTYTGPEKQVDNLATVAP